LEEKEAIVPLTKSVCMPGLIREPNKLLIETGTGIYMEKTSKDKTAFLDHKLKLVDGKDKNISNTVLSPFRK
jgi:prefoldin alpha subunit